MLSNRVREKAVKARALFGIELVDLIHQNELDLGPSGSVVGSSSTSLKDVCGGERYDHSFGPQANEEARSLSYKG